MNTNDLCLNCKTTVHTHMKKVRFETPDRGVCNKMEDQECHSPRPFTERQSNTNFQDVYCYTEVLPYSNDPEKLFESSNYSPYPSVNKTKITVPEQDPVWSPCSDLELSTFDAPIYEPTRSTFCKSILKTSELENNNAVLDNIIISNNRLSVLSPIENRIINPPKVLVEDDDFFLKRNHFKKSHFNINPVYNKSTCISSDKENSPALKKAEMVQMMSLSAVENKSLPSNAVSSYCRCHHCVKSTHPGINKEATVVSCTSDFTHHFVGHCGDTQQYNNCKCELPPPIVRSSCGNHRYQQYSQTCDRQPADVKINAVDKKTLAIEKYEEIKKSNALEVDRQANVIKEKREPTVSDLFKIIKLQNEQLQLLQDKVDKFILSSQQNTSIPLQNCITENVAIERVGEEQCKISIGVMTSFEMVRTSTIINKEVVKTSENAQIQCNRSQISIKEVVSKSQSPNLNFLDGIPHVDKSRPDHNRGVLENTGTPQINEEKTLNELSLYNVQVDNATTPLMSPDQSLYLDVRDYSDSEAESDDSNIGWTYYNKVMTHVNGVLQDSDMPSSASALYRNTRQQMQTVQMQIDKSNVSVTKRVKFGDDPLGIYQPHICAASTDTSLKMNQLAAKYLKGPSVAAQQRPTYKPTTTPIDMSFATRNYMERHKLLQNVPTTSKLPLATNMPRFLDITALKQQPKLL